VAEWKQNDWGLWVPEGSWESGPRTTSINDFRSLFKKLKSEKKYLLAKPGRKTVRGPEEAPKALKWSDLEFTKLKAHVLGRAEESVKVLVGVAFLRSLDWVPRDPEVGYRGAQYQRGRGSRGLYGADHRFPCDPTINSWSIPHYSNRSNSRALAEALKEPLRKTDLLPKPFNYADELFEFAGGKEAVVEPIRFVLHDQKPGVPPNAVLLRHAILNMLLPGFEQAHRDALAAAEADEVGIDLLNPDAIEQMNQASLSTLTNMDISRPSEHMALVRDALWYSAQLAATEGEPVGASGSAIMEYAKQLEIKSKQS